MSKIVEPETAGATLQRLGADAKLWAEDFNKTAVTLGYSEMDEGWLIGWFANAIENTCVTRRCRVDADKHRALIETLQSALQFYADAWCFTTNPKRSGLEWKPKEALLEDCGNTASEALDAAKEISA